MRVKVIGSAAGGGFPQWNCNYRLSRQARRGDAAVKPRLQSSLAVSADDAAWVLVNASPDIRQQIAETRELQPGDEAPLRSTPIKAVILTNADVDHIAGLLSLRERQPFFLYATRRILNTIEANSVFRVLDPAIVRRIELPVGAETAIDGPEGPTGISIDVFPVPGKVALFLESGDAGRDFSADEGDTIGIRLSAEGHKGEIYYVPGCARVDDSLRSRLDGSGVLLFDGTVYTDNEMVTAGVGSKTGGRMGHLAISGTDGSIAALAGVAIGRRIFVHINNTNPILDERSPEHAAVRAAGWEVAHDGMEITP